MCWSSSSLSWLKYQIFSAALAATQVQTPKLTARKAYVSRLLSKYGILFAWPSVSTPYGEHNTSVWWDIWLLHENVLTWPMASANEAVSVSLVQWVRHRSDTSLLKPSNVIKCSNWEVGWMKVSHYPIQQDLCSNLWTKTRVQEMNQETLTPRRK